MIDVEITHGQVLVAVLALMRIPQHHVLPGQTDRWTPHTFITSQVQNARHAQRPPYDRQGIIGIAHRQAAPRAEARVRFPQVAKIGIVKQVRALQH